MTYMRTPVEGTPITNRHMLARCAPGLEGKSIISTLSYMDRLEERILIRETGKPSDEVSLTCHTATGLAWGTGVLGAISLVAAPYLAPAAIGSTIVTGSSFGAFFGGLYGASSVWGVYRPWLERYVVQVGNTHPSYARWQRILYKERQLSEKLKALPDLLANRSDREQLEIAHTYFARWQGRYSYVLRTPGVLQSYNATYPG